MQTKPDTLEDLFRPQPLVRSGYLHGSPIALEPASWSVIGATFGTMIAGFVALAVFLDFPQTKPALGVLRYSKGEARVTAIKSGLIEHLWVREGQTVHRGDVLAEITTAQHVADKADLHQQILAALDREAVEDENQLTALAIAEPAQAANFSDRISQIDQQLQAYADGRQTRLAQAVLADHQLNRAQILNAQGWVSTSQRDTTQASQLASAQAVHDLDAQVANLRASRADLQNQLLRLPADMAQQRASIRGAIATLEERRAAAVGDSGFTVEAQTDGTISEVQVREGDLVDPSKPMMIIIPTGAVLLAEIYVPQSDYGFVEIGQDLRLRFDAFDVGHFGAGHARIREISNVAMRPEEVRETSIKATENQFRVLADLDLPPGADPAHPYFNVGYGKPLFLRPAYTFGADITVEDRSLLGLVLDSARAATGRVVTVGR